MRNGQGEAITHAWKCPFIFQWSFSLWPRSFYVTGYEANIISENLLSPYGAQIPLEVL